MKSSRRGDQNRRSADRGASLERGRRSFERCAWATAYDELARADREMSLAGEDLERLATATYFVGRDHEYLSTLERAHTAHVNAGVACESCHVVPARVGDGHPDGRARAQVTFSGLAVAGGATPTYDPATMTCSGVYCHGATLDVAGKVPAPSWDQELPACLICHDYPPPSHDGFPGNGFTCSQCHLKSIEAGLSRVNASMIVSVPPSRYSSVRLGPTMANEPNRKPPGASTALGLPKVPLELTGTRSRRAAVPGSAPGLR